MHASDKSGSFMALRANGWSLAKISNELGIPKSTLWDWDNKYQNEVYVLKHLQLEKLQEKYLPTYEEELSHLRVYLDKLEQALQKQDFSKMGPEYLLQMSMQIRARMVKMREQLPLRTIQINQPVEPLSFTGCVTRQNDTEFRAEYLQGDEESEDSGDLRQNSRNSSPQNRTNPDEIPGGVKNGCLSANHLQKPQPNGRPVSGVRTNFQSQRGSGRSFLVFASLHT